MIRKGKWAVGLQAAGVNYGDAPQLQHRGGGTLNLWKIRKVQEAKVAGEHLGTVLSIFQQNGGEPLSSPELSIQETLLEISSMCSQGVTDIIHVCKNSYCHIWTELPASNDYRLNILC